jgi:high-affinity K+ transport system ATPase subunit B
MSMAPAWLGAAVVVIAVAGCGAAERVEGVDRSGRAVQECSRHVDALIADRVVPRADRDYATEMCLRQR